MEIAVNGTWETPASGRRGDRVKAYRMGRVCAEPGCTTILSIYNPSPRCAVHQREAQMLRFRRVTMQEELRHCIHCGAEFTTSNPKRRYCSSRCRSQAFAVRTAAREATLAEAGLRADEKRAAA